MNLFELAEIRHKKIILCFLYFIVVLLGLMFFTVPIFNQNQTIKLDIFQLRAKNEILLARYKANSVLYEKVRSQSVLEKMAKVEGHLKQVGLAAQLNFIFWQQNVDNFNFKKSITTHFLSSYSRWIIFITHLKKQKQARIKELSMTLDPFLDEVLLTKIVWDIYEF